MAKTIMAYSFLLSLSILVLANVATAFPAMPSMAFKEKSKENQLVSFAMNMKKTISYLSYQMGNLQDSDCEVCKVVFTALKDVVDRNVSDDEIILLVAGFCTSVSIESEDVCYHAVANYLPQIKSAYMMVEYNMTISNVCGFIVGGSCIVPEEYFPVFDWNVSFPTPEPPYVPPPQPNPNSPKIRILHMSDTHFDEKYTEGAVSNCNEPICCRPKNMAPPPNEPNYAGKYGSLNGSCDIPRITLESMLDYASNNLQVDWIYWTGDIPPHDVWNQTRASNIHMLETTCTLVRDYFSSDYTVFPSCGNHEAEPCDSYPVPPAYEEYDIAYLYTQLDSVWSRFIPDIDHATVLKGGYYSYDVKPNLRVISLNMNYCHDSNWWLLVESKDPTDMLQWLIEQLEDAEKNDIKVHIHGHIPPGSCTYVWGRNYRDILDRYKGTIAGHFYGHTHNDEFEMIYDDVDTSLPISVAHVAPSVTTYSRMNPAFRVYVIDGDYPGTTWQVLDYEEYWLDVNKANSDGFPTWELLTTAKSAYSMPDLTAASFDDFINRMETDDALFQTFYQNYNRVFTDPPCEDNCKKNMLCDLKQGWTGYNATICN
ncbi:hypothetical protein CHUAL_003359 [Chamberlinius hualienensis]